MFKLSSILCVTSDSYTCRIDSDYAEIDEETTDSVVLQQNAAHCSQVQLQQNVFYITSTENNEYV